MLLRLFSLEKKRNYLVYVNLFIFLYLAVLHMTSELIHILQNVSPNGHESAKSLSKANGMTNEATKRSAMAKETRNRFDSLRRCLSVATATQTRMLPTMDRAISKISIKAKRPFSMLERVIRSIELKCKEIFMNKIFFSTVFTLNLSQITIPK